MRKRQIGGEEPLRKRQRRKNIEKPTNEEWASFLSSCHASGCRPALLSLEENFAKDYVPVATKFPTAALGNLQGDDVPATWENVEAHCCRIAGTLSLEKEVAEEIEKETRQQSKSSKWFAFRPGRVTASNAKAVCRTSVTTPSRSLVKRVCYPEATQFWSAPTSWGQQHEETARTAYMAVSKDIHANLQCSVSGLHISTKHHFLAAIPDGVLNCSCCGKGVLEIKCPYNGRERTVRELAASDSACLSIVDGTVMLKKEHSYYYQVQMQMLVCEMDKVKHRAQTVVLLGKCTVFVGDLSQAA
ncbi:hypothetical protein MTO96_003721 [Rhipicephalus appendiculatus]